MTWFWSKIGGRLGAAGTVVLLVFGAWLKGRQGGKDLLREEQERHRREAIANKRKLDSEIDDLAPADLDSRFGGWVRREDRR